MAIDVKPILRVVPTIQSAALAGNALRLLRKKRKRSRDFLRVGAETIVGTALIQEEHKFINSM